jgi:hypothetical protein
MFAGIALFGGVVATQATETRNRRLEENRTLIE